MKKGDIVSVEFPFTDLSGKKKRPALVLTHDGIDVTLAFITSKVYQAQLPDVFIAPSATNGLKMPSIIRTGKFATLKMSLVYGKLGELTLTELAAVDAGLVQSLDIKFSVQ